MNSEPPLTKSDMEHVVKALRSDLTLAISELKSFVIDRETALIWKVIALQVTLIGAIAGAQWVALMTVLQHWKP
jgi:hypothetical protein